MTLWVCSATSGATASTSSTARKGPRNGLYGLLLSRLTRARYVAHFHWKYGSWMSRISRFAVRRADAIIAVSSWTGRPIHVAGVPREHIFPVLNGIDVSAWDPSTRRRRSRAARVRRGAGGHAGRDGRPTRGVEETGDGGRSVPAGRCRSGRGRGCCSSARSWPRRRPERSAIRSSFAGSLRSRGSRSRSCSRAGGVTCARFSPPQTSSPCRRWAIRVPLLTSRRWRWRNRSSPSIQEERRSSWSTARPGWWGRWTMWRRSPRT